MKKQASLIMAALIAGSICACNKETPKDKGITDNIKTTEEKETEETTGKSEPLPSTSLNTEDNTPSETDPQIDLIEVKKDVWFVPSDDHTTYYYAVTDMDHNGKLEIICASMQGAGYFTSATFFEVNDAGDDLVECSLPNDDFEGFLFPDIITDGPIDVYTDGSQYTYIFDDTVVVNSDSSTLYTNTVSLKNTYINIYIIAGKTTGSDGSVTYNDFVKDIEESEYQAIIDEPVKGQTKSTCYFGWVPTTNTNDLNSLLKGSYQAFIG